MNVTGKVKQTDLKLKPKHKEILQLLLRFRFLNRYHLQTMLNHTSHSRVLFWLNQLSENAYIRRYYNARFAPALSIYALGPKSRKYFLYNATLAQKYQLKLFNRIWREPALSRQFRLHCLIVADIHLSLLTLSSKNNAELNFYTKTDLYGMNYLVLPHPDVYFSLKEHSGLSKRYFIDIFDELPPRMLLRKRVKQYTTYFEGAYWQEKTNKPFPEVIFICPDERSKNFSPRHFEGTQRQRT